MSDLVLNKKDDQTSKLITLCEKLTLVTGIDHLW
jgi:hypothetical protein